MKQNKTTALAGILAAALTLLPGCGQIAPAQGTPASEQPQTSENNTSSASSATAVNEEGIDITFTARDMEIGYEESTSAKVTFNGENISVNGNGASANGSILTISEEGTYILTGQLNGGHVIVNAPDSEKVQLVLRDASIYCENYAPIYIQSADKVFITLEGNSSISDGSAYTLSEEDSNVDSAIFSKSDLTINGAGSLDITAKYKHAIVSKDDLVITSGSFTITANGQGLSGKDCIKIKDGTFTLNTQGDALQSNNTEDTAKGYIYVAGGSFNIIAQTDGLQAETLLRIDGGDFNITTGGGSVNASTQAGGEARPGWGNWGRQNQTTSSDAASAKALKAGSKLSIYGGKFIIDSSDDSLHCNGDISVYQGEFTVSSGDDGIHADNKLYIENGNIEIKKSYEGLEGSNITISGGNVSVMASDDGLNAAGGNDGSAVGGRPGQNNFKSGGDTYIRISGGNIAVNASGDGIDSNGDLYIEGGNIYVSGPSNDGNGAFDYDGQGSISGGTVVAAGSSGMAMGFSNSSTQCSLLYNFSSSITAGTEVSLQDENGTVLVSWKPEKAYQSVVISVPEMAQGKSYTLTAGSQNVSITLSSITTSGGRTSGMGGGMAPRGRA